METKELLSVLGIDGVENIDQFKEKFNKSFVGRGIALEDEEIKSKIVGKITGGITTNLKREFGLENKDIEGKKVEEILELGLTKYKTKISELETNLTKNTDEKLTEWQTKAEKAKKEALEYKAQLDIVAGSLEQTKQGFEKEKKNWNISAQFNESYKKIQSMFADEVAKDALKVEGFNTIISKKYVFDLDESTNTLAVYDKEGNRVQNPAKIGAYLTPEELLVREATEHKMLKMNDGGAKPVVQKTILQQTTQQNGSGKQFTPHPNVGRFAVK